VPVTIRTLVNVSLTLPNPWTQVTTWTVWWLCLSQDTFMVQWRRHYFHIRYHRLMTIFSRFGTTAYLRKHITRTSLSNVLMKLTPSSRYCLWGSLT
jgi:hypothetical protein